MDKERLPPAEHPRGPIQLPPDTLRIKEKGKSHSAWQFAEQFGSWTTWEEESRIQVQTIACGRGPDSDFDLHLCNLLPYFHGDSFPPSQIWIYIPIKWGNVSESTFSLQVVTWVCDMNEWKASIDTVRGYKCGDSKVGRRVNRAGGSESCEPWRFTSPGTSEFPGEVKLWMVMPL